MDWNASGSISIDRAVIPRIPQSYLIAGPAQSAGYKSPYSLAIADNMLKTIMQISNTRAHGDIREYY